MDRFERGAEAFEELCRVMARLRAPDGCPWDQEQTIASLKPYLLEEAYETLEAMTSGNDEEHCEELGDLLLQIVFQAEISQETSFDIEAVARGITAKLVRRHPHVFADARADNAAEVAQSWEEIKAAEKKYRKSILEGIPAGLPALLKAYRTGEKAAGVGFDWPDASGPRAKFEEEWGELGEALEGESEDRIKEEMGDTLFALVNYSRHLGIEPEDALRGAIDKFHSRFRYVEAAASGAEAKVRDLGIDRLNELWEEAKRLEQSVPPGRIHTS